MVAEAGREQWLENFGQISVGTSDLSRAVSFWEQQLAIGPWTIFRGLVMEAVHEGRQIRMPFDVALAWHDGRLVELIQAIGDGPSPLHDGLNRATLGLQRLASLTRDIERDARIAEARGMVLITSGEAGGQRFLHYRSDEAPGLILELLERTPAFDAMVDQLRRRAQRWRPRKNSFHVADTVSAPPEQETMRAALIDDYGEAEQFRIATISVPEPGPGEVRIRVAGAAVNPVDIKARRGLLREFVSIDFPARLGGDVSGIIDAVGPGVTRFAVGDRVAGMLNPFADGAYSEFVVAHESALVIVPPALDLVDAAALPTGGLTGTQLVEVGIAPRVGDRVLVTGAGGSTGRAAVLALIEAGAIPIAGVRASSSTALADLDVEVVDLEDPTAIAAASPFDAIADTVGDPLLRGLFGFVRPDGTVASIAVPAPVPPAESDQRFCAVVVRFDGERLARFMAAAAAGKVSMPVSQRLPLDEVAQAHRLMEAGGNNGKIILRVLAD